MFVLVLAVSALNIRGRHDGASVAIAPTTFLVEGAVALTIPADWTTARVLAGPGSARVQVTSPIDPELAPAHHPGASDR